MRDRAQINKKHKTDAFRIVQLETFYQNANDPKIHIKLSILNCANGKRFIFYSQQNQILLLVKMRQNKRTKQKGKEKKSATTSFRKRKMRIEI